ncbi:hypothetical protein E4K72_01685 [Oxalobacteraceae bacterium OM1]|nr:hypothetical protein E4K72_01685 [Oxalobacteraceae bacterium OM1]
MPSNRFAMFPFPAFVRQWIYGVMLFAVLASGAAHAQTVGFRASSQASAQSGTLAIAVPAGTASGDVMVASIAVRPSTAAVTAPSGWTLVRQVVQGSNSALTLQTYYRVVSGTEPASYTWTASGGTAASGGIISLTGADTSFPVDAENGQATASSTTHTAPSLTTTQANSLLITSHAIAAVDTWTPPTGMTESVDTASSAGLAIQMNTVGVATVSTTGTKTATASPTANVGATQSIVIKPLGGLTCFTDTFSTGNGTPSSDWSVGNQGGTFGNPQIVNGRLRLTNASSSVSTYATLQRLFPASGNKVVVEFLHYAYNGSGADGVGVVLSDASIAPVAGAYGGSLGYAPKRQDQGADITHPGFAGGWIGIGIDEFGNFSSNTEGRTGGSAPGTTLDSVAIRGSGSNYSGYAYLTGTTTLSPPFDVANSTTAAPGYKYRVIVDHSDGVHAMTSVERDTGSGYSYLISPFDAKAQSGQASVPTNWYLSFTGATGGQYNIHEIANLQVCSYTQKTVSLHHLEIDQDGSACGSSTATIKACADISCTALYGGSVTVNFTATGGSGTSVSPASPITFTGGQTQVTITQTGTATLTLGATSSATANATTCYAGSTATCTLTYRSTCFDAVENGANVNTPIYTKLAGQAFNLDVLALSGGTSISTNYKGTVKIDLVDPMAASGNCTDTNTSTLGYPATTYTFTGNGGDRGRHTFTFNYAQAAANVKVRMWDSSVGVPVCSSDNFAIRPATLNLAAVSSGSNAAPNNPPSTKLAAGLDFGIAATAVNGAASAATITSGYVGTPVMGSSGVTAHDGSAVTVGTASGSQLTGKFAAGTGGVATGTFQYNDVGTFSVAANTVLDSTFTAVDQVTGIVGNVDHGTTGDCTASSISNALSNSRYGCNIGSSTLGPVGRFYPDHYEVQAQFTPACTGVGNASFTYMDNDALGIYIDVRAKSANGSTTKLLVPPFSSSVAAVGLAVDLVNGTTNGLTTRLANPSFPTVAWKGGIPTGSVTGGAFIVQSAAAMPETFTFSRSTSPDGPYDALAITTTVTDLDGSMITFLNGAAITPAASVASATTRVRYGRLKLSSAFGSELLPLSMPFIAQYWDSSLGWITNSYDNCTAIPVPTSASGLTFYGSSASNKLASTDLAARMRTAAGALTSSGSGIFSGGESAFGGNGRLILTSSASANAGPGAGHYGYVDVAPVVPSWLQYKWNGTSNSGPSARATFGGYKGSPVIYVREIY